MSQTLLTTQTPALDNLDDGTAYTMGVLFSSDVDGQILGVRAWAPSNNDWATLPATVTALIYSHDSESTGTLLASKVFGPTTAGAWNTVLFDTPVDITAGTLYVVARHTTSHFYVATSHVFDSAPLVNGHLTGLQDIPGTSANNRFVAGAFAAYPDTSFNGGLYFADPIFQPSVTTVTLGQAIETDTARPFGRLKTRLLGQAIETDTARPFGRLKTRLLGQATETDVARAFAHSRIRRIGQALDSSVARVMSVVRAAGFLHPTSEQVGVAWLKALGLPAGAVATTLPAPAADGTISWASTGFVQVAGVGGSNAVDYRLRHPVLAVTCWAVNTGSSKPPWGKANQLAEQVVAAVYSGSNWRLTGLPPAYARAHVQNARCSEPRRLPDDGGGYARYVFDLYLDWIEVS